MVQKMRKKIGRLSMPELYINKWFHKTEVGTVRHVTFKLIESYSYKDILTVSFEQIYRYKY